MTEELKRLTELLEDTRLRVDAIRASVAGKVIDKEIYDITLALIASEIWNDKHTEKQVRGQTKRLIWAASEIRNAMIEANLVKGEVKNG